MVDNEVVLLGVWSLGDVLEIMSASGRDFRQHVAVWMIVLTPMPASNSPVTESCRMAYQQRDLVRDMLADMAHLVSDDSKKLSVFIC